MLRHWPLFSIIIPTYDRPGPLAACLQACALLDYPQDGFEVIVVDDGSPRSPEAIVAPFRTRLAVTLLTRPHGGPGPARNAGAAQARGRYLAFTDDDCAPAASWLRRLEASLAVESASGLGVGGRVVNLLDENVCSLASQIILDAIYEHNQRHANPRPFFTTNNLALPADLFQAVGGFYGHFAEDRDFCDRWYDRGNTLTYAPDAVVYHAHPMTLGSFWKLHTGYGRGAYHYHRARARRNNGRYRFQPLSAFMLLRYPLWRLWRWKAPSLAGLLLLSKIGNAVGYFAEAGRLRAGRPASNGITPEADASPRA